MITRIPFLKIIACGSMALLLSGHASYRQWAVYRSERLMIVGSKSDPEAFPLTKAMVEDLKRTIPKARPEAARSPTIYSITRLILTKQIQVGVITTEQAQLMFAGKGEGAIEGPVPLRVLAYLKDPYVLVSHAEFDKNQAYQILFGLFDGEGSKTLSPQYKPLLSAIKRSQEIGIPLHIGARAFLLAAKDNSSPVEKDSTQPER